MNAVKHSNPTEIQDDDLDAAEGGMQSLSNIMNLQSAGQPELRQALADYDESGPGIVHYDESGPGIVHKTR